MSEIKLKTNVKCNACVNTITPHMEELNPVSWSVDLTDPDRTLTIAGDFNEIKVMEALKNAGYEGQVK